MPRLTLDAVHRYALSAYLRIAEPRVTRILYFIIYLVICIGGVGSLLAPPLSIEATVGVLVYGIAFFPALGGLLGVIAVLPGWWWVERAAVVALICGFLAYAVSLIALGSSTLAVCLVIAMAVSMGARWTQIQGSQLAPTR